MIDHTRAAAARDTPVRAHKRRKRPTRPASAAKAPEEPQRPYDRMRWAHAVRQELDLSTQAHSLLLTLVSYASTDTAETFVSTPTLSQNTGMKERQIYRWLDVLENHGLITRKTKVRSGRRNNTRTITLNLESPGAGDTAALSLRVKSPVSDDSASGVTDDMASPGAGDTIKRQGGKSHKNIRKKLSKNNTSKTLDARVCARKEPRKEPAKTSKSTECVRR